MKYVRKKIEEKRGNIYIQLYAPDHLNCRAHKAIQTFKSSMFEIMGFDTDYSLEKKPTYYVVHGYGENGDWIDWELGVTTELRDYVIRNAATHSAPIPSWPSCGNGYPDISSGLYRNICETPLQNGCMKKNAVYPISPTV